MTTDPGNITSTSEPTGPTSTVVPTAGRANPNLNLVLHWLLSAGIMAALYQGWRAHEVSTTVFIVAAGIVIGVIPASLLLQVAQVYLGSRTGTQAPKGPSIPPPLTALLFSLAGGGLRVAGTAVTRMLGCIALSLMLPLAFMCLALLAGCPKVQSGVMTVTNGPPAVNCDQTHHVGAQRCEDIVRDGHVIGQAPATCSATGRWWTAQVDPCPLGCTMSGEDTARCVAPPTPLTLPVTTPDGGAP